MYNNISVLHIYGHHHLAFKMQQFSLSPPLSTLHVIEPLEPFSFLTFHNYKRLCDSAALIRPWLC